MGSIERTTAKRDDLSRDPPRPFLGLVGAVMHPSHVTVDGARISLGMLESIESGAEAIALALRSMIEGQVFTTRAAHRSAIDRADLALGIEFRLRGRLGVVGVDLSVARAIVDAIAEGWTGLRGHGPLTETESGLLEYVVLRLVSVLEPMPTCSVGALGLTAILSRREISEKELGGLMRIPFDVSVRGNSGCVDLYLERLDDGSEEESIRSAARRSGGQREVMLYFEIPPLEVAESDLELCAPGDLLLLGVRDLSHLTRSAEITTSTGWRVATAKFVDTTATVLRARLDELRVSATERSAYADGKVLLRPRLGFTQIGLKDLRRFVSDSILDFSLERGGVATLVAGESEVGKAEIVRHHGELAIRLLEFSASRISES